MNKIQMLDLRREYEYMKKDIDSAIERCLSEQKWILGPQIKELEKIIADYLKVKHCIGTSSGTDALVLSLRALSLRDSKKEFFQGEKIVTTPFTFVATADAILRAGAKPVFIDIDSVSYNLDINVLEKFLKSSDGENVAGVIPVHLYGLSCDMNHITRLKDKHGFFIVEDVAQAFGGEYKNKKLGSLGDINAFSFFPSKNLGCFGDGGMVSTNDDELADFTRMLIKHGGRDKYNVDHIGYNSRLDTLQSAILLAKMEYLDEFNSRRFKIAEFYNKELSGIDIISIPESSTDIRHVYHQYTIKVQDDKRETLRKFLDDKGIAAMVYYPTSLHKMKVFKDRCEIFGELSNAEKSSEQVLSLPIEPLMTKEEMERVVKEIKNWRKGL